MAPKRANRSDQNNSVSTTDISNTRTTEQERQWDGQPYQKVSWYMLNLRALFQEIPEARQYIESGVLVGSKTVTVYSLAHVQTYVNGDYERGTLKVSFRLLDAPGRMHAHFETGRSSRIARGRRKCPTVNTAVNRVHPNHACGSGRGYQTIRGRPRGDYSIRGPNSTPLDEQNSG